MNDRLARRARLMTVAASLGILAIVFVRTAWVSDDAYITLRSVDQWLHGHGPRWNMAERVQAYSHPLWFLALTAVAAVVREPYYAAIGLSLICSIAVVALVVGARRGHIVTVALGAVLLLGSKAFIDFSSSGLENPLTNVLLVAFVLSWSPASEQAGDVGRVTRLTFLGALLLTNRLDAAVIVLPAIGVSLAALSWRDRRRALLRGGWPFAAWEAFSLFYYGFPFPNPSYAKLATGIPARELVAQGLAYFRDSWRFDPITLPAIAAAVVVATFSRAHTDWPLGLGLALYLCGVVWAGGDFMSGRFFVAPFIVAVVILTDRIRHWPIPLAAAAIVLSAYAAAQAPRIAALTGPAYTVPSGTAAGIQDERGYYYPATGLLRPDGAWRPPITERAFPSDIWRGHFIAVQDVIGMYGYGTPLTLHIIDVLGLADPLLSRLPSQRPWRIGHFYRELPEGYLDTLESGENRLRDPAIARYYDKIALVVRGPLLSPKRWLAIVQLNVGRVGP